MEVRWCYNPSSNLPPMESFIFICKFIFFSIAIRRNQPEVICIIVRGIEMFLWRFTPEQCTLPRLVAVSVESTFVASRGVSHFSTALVSFWHVFSHIQKLMWGRQGEDEYKEKRTVPAGENMKGYRCVLVCACVCVCACVWILSEYIFTCMKM